MSFGNVQMLSDLVVVKALRCSTSTPNPGRHTSVKKSTSATSVLPAAAQTTTNAEGGQGFWWTPQFLCQIAPTNYLT